MWIVFPKQMDRPILGIVVAGMLMSGIIASLWCLLPGERAMFELRRTFKSTDRHFYCVAFSPDSKLLAAGQQDGTVKIWDTLSGEEWASVTGKILPIHNFSATVLSLAFSPDGASLAWGGGDRTLTIFDLRERAIRARLDEHESTIESLVYGPDERTILTATGSKGGTVRVWDLGSRTPRVIFEEQKTKYAKHKVPDVRSVAYDRVGKTVAVGIYGTVLFLDLNGNLRGARDTYKTVVKSLAFRGDGRVLAAVAENVVLLDALTANEIASLPIERHGSSVTSVAFSPDSKLLAVGLSGPVHFPSHVEIWEVGIQRQLSRFTCHQNGLSQLAWSPDGKMLATCSVDMTVKLWEFSTGSGDVRK